MTASARSLSPTALGLDVGMTATRAALYKMEWKGKDDIQPYCVNCPTTEGITEDHNSCNFPAIAYPFDVELEPASCLGFRTDTRSQPFPLKMFCYFLRTHYLQRKGKTDKFKAIRDRIPQLDLFWEELEKTDEGHQNRVIAHLHKIFIVHLENVRNVCQSAAKKRGMIINKIAATLPPDWDIPLQKIYENILATVWNDIGGENITLLYESEAVGHWLLRQDAHDVRQERPDKIVLVDFGGHTLSSCVFDIVRGNDDESFAFFASVGQQADCSLGGSELHSTLVRMKLLGKIKRLNLQLTPQKTNQLVSNCMLFYRTAIRKNIDGRPFSLHANVGSKNYSFQFQELEARKMYQDCFYAGIPYLARKFQKVAETSTNAVVILSGGSFLNKFIFDKTVKAIADSGLKYLPWVEEMVDAGRRPGIVSMGAAIAVAYELSIEEFMRNAAFAIDISQSSSELLPVLLNRSGSRVETIQLEVAKRLSDVYIVCAPLASDSHSSAVPREITYQLEILGRYKSGTYDMSLQYERRENGNSHVLVFKQKRLDAGNKVHDEERHWPIYYDPGACVCFIDWDKLQRNVPQSHDDATSSRPRRKVARYRKDWHQVQTNMGFQYWLDSLDELDIDDWRQWIAQLNIRLRSPVLGQDDGRAVSNGGVCIQADANSLAAPTFQNLPHERAPAADMGDGLLLENASMVNADLEPGGSALNPSGAGTTYDVNITQQAKNDKGTSANMNKSAKKRARESVGAAGSSRAHLKRPPFS